MTSYQQADSAKICITPLANKILLFRLLSIILQLQSIQYILLQILLEE